jgi:hypothetical protein
VLAHRFQVTIEPSEVPSPSRRRDRYRASLKGEYASRRLLPFRFEDCGRFRTSCFVVVLLAVSLTMTSLTQADQLPSAWQHKAVGNSFSRQRTIPRVEHGYLFSFRPRILEGGGSNIFVRSLATGEEEQLTFWVNGASEIRIEDVSINGSGQIYVAGSLMRSGDLTVTSFVAGLDQTGTMTNFVDLGRYRPKRVCAPNDGTFWTFGQVLNGDSDFYRGQLLREYSADGRVLNAYLPVGKFPVLSRAEFGRTAVTLSCGDESVGLYLARPARWIEVAFSNRVAYKWRVAPAPAGTVTGMVLMGAHQVYASVARRTIGNDGQPVVPSSMYRLIVPTEEPQGQSEVPSSGGAPSDRLQSGDRPKASWAPLADVSDAAAGRVFLLGRDDQSLVYVGPRSPGADPTLYWVRPLSK